MSLHDQQRIQDRLQSVADPVGFLSNLFTHAPVGFAVWDAGGRALLTNKAFIDIFGVEPPPEYNVLKDDILAANGMLPLFQRAFAGETVHVPTMWFDPRELQLIRVTEGRRVAISMTIFPLFRKGGEIEYVAATYKDETEIMQANERLRVGEERQRLAEQVARVGTFEWNVQTGVNTWTPELEALYGLDPGEFGSTQQSWEQLVHPDDRPAAVRRVNEALRTFSPVEGEWRAVWPDGTVRWLVGRFQVLKDAAGKPHRLIGVNVDITERTRAEAEARESEARKGAVMEAALDAIVLMDHEGKISEFNAAAERTFGYSRDEVVGRPLADVIVPPALRERHRAALKRYLETGEGNIIGRRIEVPALRKDGTEFPAEVAIVRIRSEGSALFTGYIRDITDRLQAAEAELLRRENEAAQAANRELEAFSYSVAHDLRAPLRSIGGFTGAFLEDHGHELDEKAKEPLRRVAASAQRMGHMIDALLSLARLSRAELRREEVDLSEMVRSVTGHLRAAEPGRSVDLVAQEGLLASADRQLVRIVLDNLIGNAWKFTRDQPRARIEFGGTTVSEGVRYHVRDNGAGFNQAFASRLFTPFQRLHSSDEFEGTGVGLATVQRIIQRHGGRVWAEAREKEGATVFFTLQEDRPRTGASLVPAT